MTDPTAPATLIPGLPGLRRMPVLVTGGTGALGRAVVAELIRARVPVRVLTHHTLAPPGVTGVEGDLVTGAGLAQALESVGAVINCATGAGRDDSVDVEGTAQLAGAMREAGQPRLVHMSIVGCWDNPLPYYRAKCSAETAVVESGLPHAIVRATQFHSLVARLLRPRAGLTTATSGMRVAPVESDWVAARLVDVALAETTPGNVLQLAGPELLTARDAAVLTAHALGIPLRRHVTLPAVGAVPRAFARGSNLPGPDAERGGCTYAQWLGDQHDLAAAPG